MSRVSLSITITITGHPSLDVPKDRFAGGWGYWYKKESRISTDADNELFENA